MSSLISAPIDCIARGSVHDFVFVAVNQYRDADHREHTAEVYRCLRCGSGKTWFVPLEGLDDEQRTR